MDGTPAGWYDDPEQPGQQRYWDGTAWTDDRAPGPAAPTPPPTPPPTPAPTPPPTPAPTAPPVPPPPTAPGPPPPGGASAPPPGAPPAAPARSSNKAVWIIVAVLGAVAALVILAIVAVTFLGGDGVTATLEKELPAELQSDLSSQGLDVNVTTVDCDDVSDSDGPFTTTCAATVEGLSSPLNVEVKGTVDGDAVRAVTATSDPILDQSLAVTQSQALVDTIDSSVTVTSCALPDPVVLVTDSLTFTCELDTTETVTFGVQGGRLVIQSVS